MMKAGTALDALIAEKVFGIKVEWDDWSSSGTRPYSYAFRDKYDEIGYVPEYSTDIASAMVVLRKIRDLLPERRKVFTAALLERLQIGFSVTVGWDEAIFYLDASEICLAALQAVGVDLPEMK